VATSAPEVTTASPQATATGRPLLALLDTEWLLTSLNGSSPVAGTRITLFVGVRGQMAGDSGCGLYSAQYTGNGGQFHIHSIDPPSFDCVVPGAAKQQALYFEALKAVAAYQVSVKHLEFQNATGETILAYDRKLPPTLDPDLEGILWILQRLRGQSLIEGSHISLRFGPEGIAGFKRRNFVSGFAGCNRYTGDFEAADQGLLKVRNVEVRWAWETGRYCDTPQGVTEQEKAYIEALRSGATYRLSDGHLEVRDTTGETILLYTPQRAFSGDPTELVGTAWQFASMEGWGLDKDLLITLVFHDRHRASGHAGCVDYAMSYEAQDGDLELTSITFLGHDCPPGVPVKRETAYTSDLPLTAHYRLDERQLELITIWGEALVFKPFPERFRPDLEGPTWVLQAFVEPNPYAQSPEVFPRSLDALNETEITIEFEAGSATGLAGCNMYAASYRREAASFSLDTITASSMACYYPEEVMEQERRYLDFLDAVDIGHLYGDQLWLETDDGRALVFSIVEPPVTAVIERNSILIQLDWEGGYQPPEATVPFGRVPEFTVLADGRVFYVDSRLLSEPGQQDVLWARLTAAEVERLTQHVLDLGLGYLGSYTDQCWRFADGREQCVYDAATSVLRARIPNGSYSEIRNYAGFANDPEALNAIRLLLTEYRHPRAQRYLPEKATHFIRSIPSAEGLTVHSWPLEPAWLTPPDPGTKQWARVLTGDDLGAILAAVEGNMGYSYFDYGSQFFETKLVPWLPGVDYTDAVAAYRWP
jgi:heat shock protein HslJ